MPPPATRSWPWPLPIMVLPRPPASQPYIQAQLLIRITSLILALPLTLIPALASHLP